MKHFILLSILLSSVSLHSMTHENQHNDFKKKNYSSTDSSWIIDKNISSPQKNSAQKSIDCDESFEKLGSSDNEEDNMDTCLTESTFELKGDVRPPKFLDNSVFVPRGYVQDALYASNPPVNPYTNQPIKNSQSTKKLAAEFAQKRWENEHKYTKKTKEQEKYKRLRY